MTKLALPEGYETTIRKPSSSLRSLITRVVPKWQGNRIVLRYATSVHIRVHAGASASKPTVHLMRLSDGWLDTPVISILEPREGARGAERRAAIRGVSGAILEGQAVLSFAGKGYDQNTAIPTIHVHTVSDSPATQAELSVARDAFQEEGGRDTADKIVRKIIPIAASLYLALLETETKYLTETIAKQSVEI